MVLTLAVMYNIRDIQPERISPVARHEHKWSDRDMNLPINLLTQNVFCVQEMQSWGMEQRLAECPNNKHTNLRPLPLVNTTSS